MSELTITKHISFYYIPDRIKYINRIIDETNTYKSKTDIFIHTNSLELTNNLINPYTNGSLYIIHHDLKDEHPFYLTWKCRYLLSKQRNDYDIFMYIEDDILVPYKAIEYWLEYNEKLISLNYNLGFLRIEHDNNNIEYTSDLDDKINKLVKIDGQYYAVNDVSPYCAFWIYNKNEFNRFVESEYYDINNIPWYYRIGDPNAFVREKSAIGLHGIQIKKIWYKDTLIPLSNIFITDRCKIYHMPNNYVYQPNTKLGKLKFDDCLDINAYKNITYL